MAELEFLLIEEFKMFLKARNLIEVESYKIYNKQSLRI